MFVIVNRVGAVFGCRFGLRLIEARGGRDGPENEEQGR